MVLASHDDGNVVVIVDNGDIKSRRGLCIKDNESNRLGTYVKDWTFYEPIAYRWIIINTSHDMGI